MAVLELGKVPDDLTCLALDNGLIFPKLVGEVREGCLVGVVIEYDFTC